MAYCVNHTWVETGQACPDCLRPLCESCLVEFLGQRYCGPCRDRRLLAMQGGPTNAPLAGTGIVDIGGWLSGGWQIIKDDLPAFVLATLVAGLVSLASCYICLGPMWCGLLIMSYRKLQTGHTDFGHLFDGFQRFLWSFLLALLIGVVSYAVSLLFNIPFLAVVGATDDPALFGVAMLAYYGASFLATTIIGGVTFFAMPHVAARNANPIEALGASIQVFRRNPLMFALASLVFYLVSMIGFAALCVGLLVTVPLAIAAYARAYADHFGLPGEQPV